MKNLLSIASCLVFCTLLVVGCTLPTNGWENPHAGLRNNNDPACPANICGTGNETVIYGEDNRLDMWKAKKYKVNAGVLTNAEAVASSWDKYRLVKTYDGKTTMLRTTTFGDAYDLAPGEPFRDQPIGAHCTSFLVAPDIIVTAGHCLDGINLLNKRFIFGFRVDEKGKYPRRVLTKNIYAPKKIISRVLSKYGADYAVIRLDRKVEGITPLKLAKTNVKKGEWVYVLGHPCGLPLKYAPCGKVVNTSSSTYFIATVDTFGGNSGSPVFNDKNEVVGILVRGESDFNFTSEGRISRQGTHGESCTKVSVWAKFVTGE